MKKYYVYFMTNAHNTVLYVGVTSNLIKRVYEHKIKKNPKSFTARYNLDKLIYYEVYDTPDEAIAREKQIKKWNRKRKNELVERENPEWKDLSEGWIFDFS